MTNDECTVVNAFLDLVKEFLDSQEDVPQYIYSAYGDAKLTADPCKDGCTTENVNGGNVVRRCTVCGFEFPF